MCMGIPEGRVILSGGSRMGKVIFVVPRKYFLLGLTKKLVLSLTP